MGLCVLRLWSTDKLLPFQTADEVSVKGKYSILKLKSKQIVFQKRLLNHK